MMRDDLELARKGAAKECMERIETLESDIAAKQLDIQQLKTR